MDESRLDAMREAMASMSLRGVSREFLSRVCGRGYEMDDDEGDDDDEAGASIAAGSSFGPPLPPHLLRGKLRREALALVLQLRPAVEECCTLRQSLCGGVAQAHEALLLEAELAAQRRKGSWPAPPPCARPSRRIRLASAQPVHQGCPAM